MEDELMFKSLMMKMGCFEMFTNADPELVDKILDSDNNANEVVMEELLELHGYYTHIICLN